MNAFHPSSRLLCWILLVLAIQRLDGAALAFACGALPLLGRDVLRHWWRLMWRTRWVIVSIVVILGWGVAGMPLWESGLPAPTREGMADAAVQVGRLSLVLAAVAYLLETMPMPSLMAGLLGLCSPAGVPAARARTTVARLLLTLRYAESLPPMGSWHALLAGQMPETPAPVETDFLLVLPPFRMRDLALVLAVAVPAVAFMAFA